MGSGYGWSRHRQPRGGFHLKPVGFQGLQKWGVQEQSCSISENKALHLFKSIPRCVSLGEGSRAASALLPPVRHLATQAPLRGH